MGRGKQHGKGWRGGLPRGWLPLLALLALLAASCGRPKPGDPVGVVNDPGAPVPAGAHLYCIANVSHTLVAYSLAEGRTLPDTARYLDLDPVGPWFVGGDGYYISRVDGSGAGSNALIRFDPKSKIETGRLKFPGNSNPNSFFPVPGFPGLAWVALRGSTFDGFATNGLSVVNLSTMRDTAFCDLNAATATCARLMPGQGQTLTSLLGFFDATGSACAGCVLGIVNNFDETGVRSGWLGVWSVDGQGRPVFRDGVPLGRNPLHPPLLDAAGLVWVVNNGGYVHFDLTGEAGTLQVLDPAAFDNGTPGDETAATLAIESGAACAGLPRPDPGCDPTGLFSTDGLTGWLTTYPDDVLRTVDLAGPAVAAPDPAFDSVSGPFFQTLNPAPGVFAAAGGLGLARLGAFDEVTGTFLFTPVSLEAGLGPVTCTETIVP